MTKMTYTKKNKGGGKTFQKKKLAIYILEETVDKERTDTQIKIIFII